MKANNLFQFSQFGNSKNETPNKSANSYAVGFWLSVQLLGGGVEGSEK